MSKISKAKRLKVAKHARYRCEYRWLHEDDLFYLHS